MDRPLLKPAHWRRYTGHQVDVRLYRGKDGIKNITGTLESFDDGSAASEAAGAETAKAADPVVIITDESGKRWELALSEIARARLAVIF